MDANKCQILDTGKLLVAAGCIFEVDFNKKNNFLAGAGPSGIYFYDTGGFYDKLWKTVPQPLKHKKNFRTVNFHPDGNLLAIGGRENPVEFFDIKNKKIDTFIEGTCVALRFTQEGNELLIAGSNLDDRARIFDVEKKKEKILFNTVVPCDYHFVTECQITDALFNADDTLIALCACSTEQAYLRLFDVRSGKPTHIHHADNGKPIRVCFSENLLALSNDTIVSTYDVRKLPDNPWQEMSINRFEFKHKAQDASFSPQGGYLAVLECRFHRDPQLQSGYEANVHIFDLETEKIVQSYNSENIAWSVDFSPCGKFLAATLEPK